MLMRVSRSQSESTAASTSATGDGVGSPTSVLPLLPCKDAPLLKHKSFTSMKTKQNSLPTRTRMASLSCEPQKFQLNLDKDAARPKPGSGRQSRCPPPVPPRKNIPDIVKEIRQVKMEIEQLTAEVSQCTTYV